MKWVPEMGQLGLNLPPALITVKIISHRMLDANAGEGGVRIEVDGTKKLRAKGEGVDFNVEVPGDR